MQQPPTPPTPTPDLKSLDRLVGTWQVAGGTQGQITYEWMEGGFFLSRCYDSLGNTLDYVDELDGDTLTIWAGEKDSPAYYRAPSATTTTPKPATGCIQEAAGTSPR